MPDLIVQFLTQLGGGPGPAENNLVRFGLPAIFWAVLFVVAWSRQRREYLPRERLLLFGFGLAFARELFMFLHTVERILRGPVSETHSSYIEPLEHGLAVSAVLVISAAFMRYILDEEELPRRYLIFGLSAVGVGIAISFLFWPAQHSANPDMHFHKTAGAWFMHLTKAIFVTIAIFILIRNKGWVRNVVIVALSLLLGSVLLTLLNTLSGRAYDYVLCPISNNLHIWAVPIFGFVYFREQSIAKKQAEEALAVHREHLEQLVTRRTAELSTANEQLQQEIAERMRAESAAEQWAVGMSRLHEISLLLNTTLEPAEICRLITSQAVALLACSAAGLFRLQADGRAALGVASQGMVAGGVDGMRLQVTGSETLQQLVSGSDPLVVDDVRSDPRIPRGLWKRYPMRALLGTTVRGTGELRGFLFLVESTRTRCWQAAEIKVLQNFANRAGIAWENAYLHKQLEWAAALEERQRIAAEMHDGLAQTISMLALRNDQAAQMVENRRFKPALNELSQIQDIISVAGSDLRRSIASLHENPRLPCSLQEAIGELVNGDYDGTTAKTGFNSTITTPLHLPPEQLDQIVNIVQEALLNASRHGHADHITVQLAKAGPQVNISIEDDGIGFDVEAAAGQPGNHFGLSIMRARAQRIGGTFSIDSAPGLGTHVLLSWPGPDEDAAGSDSGDSTETAEKLFFDLIDNRERRLWRN